MEFRKLRLTQTDDLIDRQTELRGSGGVHPGSVRGEKQEHNEGGVLPPDLCHGH